MRELEKINLITHVVTFNDESSILPTLKSLIEQDGFVLGKNYHIILSDNNSEDKTLELVKHYFGDLVQIVEHKKNLGFCRAHNLCFRKAVNAGVDYVFIANPDLKLESDTLKILVEGLEQDKAAGVACPKLLRADENLLPVQPLLFDSTGMFITPAVRHFDRGSNELADNRFNKTEYVFGASGAAALFKRDFLSNVALRNDQELEVFDESFFAYREDADLAWRAQLLNWKCRYEPTAIGYHKRHVLPEKRKKLKSELNSMSVRNRFLLQLNNLSPSRNLKCLLPALFRNLLVIGASLTVERSSFKGLKEGIFEIPKALKKRKSIKKQKTKSAAKLNRWFSNEPYSEPAPSFQKAEAIKKLQVIIVNFNSGKRLENCLRILQDALKKLKVEYQISIIDNASSDTSATKVAKKHKNDPKLSIKLLKGNTGFAGAINRAAKNTNADAMLILNPDIEIGAKCINEQINCLNSHKEIAAVGPILYGTDGSIQKGFFARRFPSLASSLAELFFIHRLWKNNPWTAEYLYKNEAELEKLLIEKSNTPLFVDQPAGCSLMVRTSAFDAVKGFDEGFHPAWFEDVDFCKRLKNAGYESAIIGSASAVHEGGYSYKSLRSAKFYRIWYKNMLRYFNKHASRKDYLILRTLLIPALLLRSTLALLTGIRKKEQRELAKELINISFDIDSEERNKVGNL